jgi:hypothetical protein
MAFFKSLFRKPLTHRELLREAERLINNPPLPPDWKATAVGIVGTSGVSLLDYWRDYFKSQLEAVSFEQTWSLQRSKLLRLVLLEQEWRVVEKATQNARSTNSWAHLLNDAER